MNMVFGGYILNSDGNRHQLEVILDPEDCVVKDTLDFISERSGVITMRHQLEREGLPYELILHFENGNFLLMLNEYDEHGEHIARMLVNLNSVNELVGVLGEKYPASAVTHDKNLVCDIFIFFSHEGNVPLGIMA